VFYAARGDVPHKRHTQHRAPDGSLYAEELFGVEGFTGRSSLIYHRLPPTRVREIEPLGSVHVEIADDGSHHHALVDSAKLAPAGDPIGGRVPLFTNSDVTMGVVLPADPMPERTYYRNGEMDELLFIHEGTGTLHTNFGDLAYHAGDYLVLPIGTTWRSCSSTPRTRSATSGSPSSSRRASSTVTSG
jgi:homogentisate 1,2-dioxygenase